MEVLQRTANRGSVSTGFNIDNSLKFEADNTEYLSFANSVGENRRTWTYSTWVKKTELFGAGSVGGTLFGAYLSSNDRARIEQYADQLGLHGKISGTTAVNVRTNRVLRDTAAWYHCMVVLDTTQATETDRVKIYINGVQETSMVSAVYPPQNYQFAINNAVNHFVGQKGDNTDYFCGYMAETYFIDGQALTPTSFGEFDEDSGIWKPIEFTGTYPSADTNHFYLNFDDSSSLGADSSGNGKNMSLTNIAAADQSTDTPTNNFCTLNQIALDGSVGSSGNITQGATKATATEFDVFVTFAPTFGVTSGKWYAEFEYEGGQADNLAGILDIDAVVPYNSRLGKAGQWSVGFYQANGKLYVTSDSGVTSTANWGASAANGDIISVAVDMDNHFVYFAKNGTWQNSGVPTSGSTGTGGVAFDSNKTVGIGCSSYDQGSDEGQIFANYGGYTAGTISSAASDANGYGTFEYAPPSGYYALCGKNLAEFGGEA